MTALHMVQTFTKKPIQIEAILVTLDTISEAMAWANSIMPADKQIAVKYKKAEGRFDGTLQAIGLIIPTKEGDMLCSIGDYLIKEPFPTDDRMFYPCKPDMLHLTYDENK